jgi:uracil-DNA glycosylase
MSLTREDILRELELLPVWKLRAPVAIARPMPTLAQAQAKTLRIIVSDDTDYLFLLEALQGSEEEVLLQNMLKAMHVKPRVDIGLQSMSDLSVYSPTIMIAMGEAAARSLLDIDDSLENLRGKLHQHNNLPVIVTYHPSHLLKNSADKAQAWQDLCLVKSTI